MNIKKISIKNFRVFKEQTTFQLKPITILTGTNNSGKSSLLKLINLLHSSFDKNNSTNELLFNSGNHNLGTFDDAITRDSDNDFIKIVFDFPLDYFDEDFKLELEYKKLEENAVIKSFRIFNKQRDFFVLKNLLFSYHDGSEIDYSFSLDLAYLKRTIKQHTTCREFSSYSEDIRKAYSKYLTKFNPNNSTGLDPNKNFNNLRFRLKYGLEFEDYPLPIDLFTKEYFFEEYKKIESQSFQFCEVYTTENELFKDPKIDQAENERFNDISTINFGFKIRNSDFFTDIFYEGWDADFEHYLISLDLESILKKENFEINEISVSNEAEEYINKFFIQNINQAIKTTKFSFDNFSFLTATRGNKKRVLENTSDNDLDEIVKEFIKLNVLGQYYHYNDEGNKVFRDNESSIFLKKALKILNIKGELVLERIQGSISIVYLKQAKSKIPLADLGYGYSQIIPILLKILIVNHKTAIKNKWYNNPLRDNLLIEDLNIIKQLFPATLIIEEPEANLHPNLQSKLADIFVLAYNTFGVKFILETHSEYLIRKLQYLTAKKEINTDDSVVYYFNADEYVNNKEPKVKEIFIDKFGGLSDTFGPGFYDEATKLQFDLIRLQKQQMN
jgi:predicted ATPase